MCCIGLCQIFFASFVASDELVKAILVQAKCERSYALFVDIMASADAKKKCRQYSQEYLKFGFIASLSNETMPMFLLYQKVFSNDAMKPSKMKDHLEKGFTLIRKTKILRIESISTASSNNVAKKAQSYTIGEEIVIPAIKEVIETVMKKDSEPVLKCIPLSAKAVQRRIDEMASDVEKTLVLELQHCKFSIQLDESAFGCSNILMVYVRYYSQSLKCIVDEFLFANYLKSDAESDTVFRCLEDYLKEHSVYYCSDYRWCTSNGWPLQRICHLTRRDGLGCTRCSLRVTQTSSCCQESQW
ncbi:Zinc finger BED domain-containing protein 5 [Trichinella murrelli]|uniref:Zinc finger BED domain-containing protein 5 n=1 Tax=Trichinella murrelli TaxID=144512 RepID=A0A0V0T7T3_9BILA|nr:Zinc finger BED domain-containing protein 5 [Trichinella murrelli]